ncbi:MAG TPA: alpha/beta hydrolase-fold protein [Gemmatimonadaceae bacterium]|nr:alpha/beta hydrolase-fold protein [Gemmatimonadaceae bacterium]
MTKRFRSALSALASLAAPMILPAQARFEITVPSSAHAGPITGRAYVALSKSNDAQRPPIQQTGETGVPLFGVDIDEVTPGRAIVVDARAFGFPSRSLRDIPAGEYWVQPFINVYTKFARADGHTVWLHMDQWEGQHWQRSPGNLFGEPVKVTFDPKSSTPIKLVADKVIPPVKVPADNDYVKRIKIQSDILTKWWGHPIYLGATILLPKDYDKHPDVKFPVVYDEGHFSLGAPGGFGGAGGRGRGSGRGGAQQSFTDYWQADGTPRMLLVTLQHPSPYYDDSYGVNSANNGPYGDAITKELIPAVESKFRAIGQPYARLLTGGSTGGWISLAHQVFYPDFYGGTWSLCPDGVDFRYHQIVNVYSDTNAYFIEHPWMKVERPTQRRPDGNIVAMMKDENWSELAQGDHSRSGGQWDIWEATYGPAGADGYPQRIWDKTSGVIDHKIAAYWKERYDLRNILETNWATLGPKVANKINVYVGDADSYYLNMGVHMLDTFLRATTAPKWSGEIVFQPMAPHCWGPPLSELLPKMSAQVDKNAPAGADTKSWKY